MRDWSRMPERRLLAMAVTILAVVLAVELYHHLGVTPVTSTLLFELLEVVLLAGCTVTCTLAILRVRVPEMAMATTLMLTVLLAGELFLGGEPVALRVLLVELLEVVLVVGGSTALVLSVRRSS
jgi:hypothetical protein